MAEKQDVTELVGELFREAREKLGPNASFRLRVLLDMALVELDREAATAPRPDKPAEPSVE
ncbi:hypothetical protein GCM10007884_24550 [Methylobacterium brachythecii]|uniref:Uncharacterized protein n=1 Tax=Methylobacterium brachythecii TaxID=1176177 RepID=A0ABQ6D323_9HYPH|nr:hypothetical protein GCM10007884_24550 [Methylobacterium brachythecii]